MRLTLASQSPRRAKILADLGVEFDVVKTDAPEVSLPHDPEGTVVANARAKLLACGRAPALAADTIVWFAGKIYGKPRDLAEAKAFLRELSGQTHIVFTGVAYLPPCSSPDASSDHKDAHSVHKSLAPIRTACTRSHVTFRELSDADIDEYVARVRPTDRAGAYDIDENGDLIVASYTGSYENIMGLPIEPLREFGII